MKEKNMSDYLQDPSNALANAENEQQKISQKEFEIKLAEINSRYSSPKDNNAYFYNQQKKMLLESELTSHKAQRDNYINLALLYALNLAEQEIMNKQSYSQASIIITSICTFLKIQNIHLSLSFPVMMKISSLNYALMLHQSEFFSLKLALTSLKGYFGV